MTGIAAPAFMPTGRFAMPRWRLAPRGAAWTACAVWTVWAVCAVCAVWAGNALATRVRWLAGGIRSHYGGAAGITSGSSVRDTFWRPHLR
jgi:hypothetical protein